MTSFKDPTCAILMKTSCLLLSLMSISSVEGRLA
eukprot:CAMPEP_0181412144 /NCGR_PEP_ID=MMETSP1110-20121109/8268_1 /TAXON_ID=174948 /ORGANISM="Symbiodinium sp., Strain CCMP421" /LENGTH=33 /DNA_ID= /DNA_START= /DNA_END= /DNA_ORIENTATION=